MRTPITTSLALALALSACGASQEPDTSTMPPAEEPVAAPTPAQTEPAPEATPPAAEGTQPQATGTQPSPGVSATPQMSDNQIAAFLAAANKAEIQSSELVKKSKNAEVKKLAAEIIKDHAAADKKGTAMFSKADITPEATGEVQTLETKAQSVMEQLKGLKGTALDKAYVDAQVTMHQDVIDAIDQKLLPAAQNADLKSFINEIRPTLQAHLDHAKAVQAKLGAAK